MLTTPNYGLRKPEGGDPVDVRDLNDNFDTIDKELKNRPTSDGNASQMTVEFEDAKQLTELTSNDTLKNLFGKLKLMVKKVIRHGELLGDTNIAGIGDGTVTGAIHAQNSTVSQCLKSVSDGKSTVASAITAQGVTTAADATFDVMAANVTAAGNARYHAGVAATKVGTAAAANVLLGKTFTNASTVGASGSMPNQGAWTGAATGSGNVMIPAGYHNGSGYVSGSGAYNAGIAAADARANVNSANYQAGYNAGILAGGSGKYVVKTGSVTRTQAGGNTWTTETVSTGLTTVVGAMARVVADYGSESGVGFFMDSASGGIVAFRGIGFNGTVTIHWVAYGN